MIEDDQRQMYISDAESLLEKLHAYWGDCMWIDAGELIAFEAIIELAKKSKQ